jgi:flagellar basal body rod protein FlgB
MAAVNLGAGDIIERLRGILEATQQAKMQELERNVDIDSEMARMAENSHEYAVMIRLVSDRFSGLRSAIIGR